MTATTIDTLELARELREGGVDEKPAAAIAQAIKRGVESTPAPTEITQIKAENADIKTTIGEMKTDIAGVKTDLAEMRSNIRWVKWGMGFIIAAIIGIVWQLIAINRQLAAMTAMVERLAQ